MWKVNFSKIDIFKMLIGWSVIAWIVVSCHQTKHTNIEIIASPQCGDMYLVDFMQINEVEFLKNLDNAFGYMKLIGFSDDNWIFLLPNKVYNGIDRPEDAVKKSDYFSGNVVVLPKSQIDSLNKRGAIEKIYRKGELDKNL